MKSCLEKFEKKALKFAGISHKTTTVLASSVNQHAKTTNVRDLLLSNNIAIITKYEVLQRFDTDDQWSIDFETANV